MQQLHTFLAQQYADRPRLDKEEKTILVQRWSRGELTSLAVSSAIEQFCKQNNLLDEEAFATAVEDVLAPKLRDRLLDEDEENFATQTIKAQGWPRASDEVIAEKIEEIVDQNSGFLSRKLKPMFARQIMEGRGQGKTIQQIRVEILQWAESQSIDRCRYSAKCPTLWDAFLIFGASNIHNGQDPKLAEEHLAARLESFFLERSGSQGLLTFFAQVDANVCFLMH